MVLDLEGTGSLLVKRSLLPWSGIDFARPEDPRVRGARANERGYTAPTAADLDRDGRVDLVVGGDKGDLVWMRDEATSGRPCFGKPAALVGRAGCHRAGEGDRGHPRVTPEHLQRALVEPLEPTVHSLQAAHPATVGDRSRRGCR